MFFVCVHTQNIFFDTLYLSMICLYIVDDWLFWSRFEACGRCSASWSVWPYCLGKGCSAFLCDGMDFSASQDCLSQIEQMKKSVALHLGALSQMSDQQRILRYGWRLHYIHPSSELHLFEKGIQKNLLVA